MKTEVWVSIVDGPQHMPCDQLWVNLPSADAVRAGRMGANVGANLLHLIGQQVQTEISIDGVLWKADAKVTGFAYTDYADDDEDGSSSQLELLAAPERA